MDTPTPTRSRPRERSLIDAFSSASSATDWARLIGGGLLTLYGLRRGKLLGWMLAGLGGRLLYKQSQAPATPRTMRRQAPLPSQRAEQPGPTIVGDPVAEASWESFPASDSPGKY